MLEFTLKGRPSWADDSYKAISKAPSSLWRPPDKRFKKRLATRVRLIVRSLMNSNIDGSPRELNGSQKRHIRVLCEYVDRLLSDIESILASAASKSAFPRYISEISPAARPEIDAYIARIRAHLTSVLDSQGITAERAAIPDARAVSATLDSIDIASDELRPKNMRGYGPVPHAVAAELEGMADKLQSLVSQFNEFMLSSRDL